MSKKSTWDDWGDDLDDEEPRSTLATIGLEENEAPRSSLATIGLEEDEAPRSSLATIGLPEEEVESSRRSLANIGLEEDEAPRSSLATIGLEPAEREQPRGGRGAAEEEEEEEASGGGSRSLENIGLEGEDEHMAITWECFACGTKNPVTKMHCSKCMCAVTVSNQQRGAAAGRNLQGNLEVAKKDKAVSMDATHQADGLGGGSGGGDGAGGNRPRAASAGGLGSWIGWAAGGVLSGVGTVAGGAVRGVGTIAKGVGGAAVATVGAVASLSPRSGQAAATAAASGEGADASAPSSPVPATAPPSPPAAAPAGADMTISQAFGSVMRRSNNTSAKQRSKGGGKAD